MMRLGKNLSAYTGLCSGALAIGLGIAALVPAAPAAAQSDDGVFVGAALYEDDDPDSDAGGDFSAELDAANGRICYMLEVYGLTDVTAAHIHEGRKGRTGPPVVTLELVGDADDDICTDVDAELLADMAENPEDYYVNVHTAREPSGAVRGQLEG